VSAIEVKGLSQALANLEKLSKDVQLKLPRDALRDASWVIANAIRSTTYNTFSKLTGAIQSGFSVQVAQQPHTPTELDAYVVQYQQAIGGTSPATILFRNAVLSHRRRGRSRKPIDVRQVAFWWRFLEFGTQPRKASRTPSFVRQHKTARTQRQHKQLAAFNAAPSRGGIHGRSWVRPAFSASAETAVQTFRDSLLRGLTTETDQLPK
jgi:HK97 gp10 family phage protein